jgi:hypothetical protein
VRRLAVCVPPGFGVCKRSRFGVWMWSRFGVWMWSPLGAWMWLCWLAGRVVERRSRPNRVGYRRVGYRRLVGRCRLVGRPLAKCARLFRQLVAVGSQGRAVPVR